MAPFAQAPENQTNTPIVRKPVRLFTEKATTVAAAIGGPLPAAYLIAKNFRSLGKQRAANMTLVIGAAITLALITVLLLLPYHVVEKIPAHFLPLAYGIAGYAVVKKFQQRDIDAHLQGGGKKGSWLVTIVVGLMGLVLTFAFVVLVAFLDPSDPKVFDGEPYKFEKSGATLYYDKATIPEADVKFVGNELEAMGYFSKDNPLPAAFRKEGNKYTVELILDEKDWGAAFVKNDIPQFLRVLRQWHRDSEFQVRFVAIDLLGQRRTKLFSEP